MANMLPTRMANWIRRQERHLSRDEFARWIASNVQVRAYLKARQGWTASDYAIEDRKIKILTTIVKPELAAASKALAGIEKRDAGSVKQTGTLQMSIGSVPVKLYMASFCGWVASGVRRGYARAVEVVTNSRGKKRLKKLSKKATAATPAGTMLRNPVFYSRILRHGHQGAFRPKSAKAFPLLMAGGTFFRARAGYAAPRDFMGGARSDAAMIRQAAADNMAKRIAETS